MGRRSWWICWDAMNGGKQFVVDRKPSGISAGGNMVNVQAREVLPGDVVLSEVEVIRIMEKLKRIGCDVVGPCDSCDIKRIIELASKNTSST